jgi:hypothetical protein
VLAPALLLFVASAEADSDAIAAVVEAAVQALGAGARITVHGYEDVPPDDAELAAAARAHQAAAAARLVWSHPGRTRAALDVHIVHADATAHREFEFEPHDRLSERARAIGLVLASVVLADGTAAPPPAAQARAKPDGDLEGVATVPSAVPGRWSLEAFANGGLAFGPAGGGLGGGVGARLYGQSSWGARLGVHARGGSVAVAQASSLAAAISAGAFRSLLTSSQERVWKLTARAELMLMYEALTHFSSDDPEPVHRGRFLPGAAALLEGEWRISPSAALHLAAGVEGAFGITRVLVRGVEVSELAPIRGVLEAGLRARF